MSGTVTTLTTGFRGFGLCDACGREIGEEDAYVIVHDTKPWLVEDDENNTYLIQQWHKCCDQGSLAADAAVDIRR